ncbi:MAG: adenosylcobinamide amidohydrolase [Syntrophobacteraceae bacterium]|jgi:ABC-type Fe3+-hydroxamate transport system substrate-binding protein/adenosylcobinamide amidohydrolase
MLGGKGNLFPYFGISTLVSATRGTSDSMRRSLTGAFLLLLLLGGDSALAAYPVSFLDSSGSHIILQKKPRNVVSLVPAVTEIIFRLGAGDCLAGVTIHDTLPPESDHKSIVGGFLAPSLSRIEAIQPDVLFVSSMHRGIFNGLAEQGCQAIELESHSISDLYRNIALLGAIFDKEAKAEEIIEGIRKELALISSKVEKIPANRRKRVMRVMGISRDSLMAPGDDSFQNEFIRSAGGLPPQFGKKGEAVSVTLEEWKKFDPEVVCDCGGDRKAIDRFLSQPGWKDVQAVRGGKVFSFPCAMTCRASVQTGDFVAWLASTIYDEEFAEDSNRVLEEKPLRTRSVELPLRYVRSARVDETTIFDFPNKTLIVEFTEPMRVISTLEGERKGITVVGNHYFPPPCWSIEYRLGFEKWRKHAFKTIGKTQDRCCLLFTGADMRNLSVQKAQFKDMTVYALVTAGVEDNAMRMSVDEGMFYEPGTVNIILLTNMKLSQRAMARAVITATEAKTAALQDLDVRSSYSSGKSQATGTGTDEVLVVEGRGTAVDNAGGHCKLGELIARAVYDGVKEAVRQQNGISTRRGVFRRLRERHINICEILKGGALPGDGPVERRRLARFEQVLLQPRYASFLESAFALSDANEKGLLSNLGAFETWCRSVAEEIAGKKLETWSDFITSEEIPVVMRMSLNALLNGLLSEDDYSNKMPSAASALNALLNGLVSEERQPAGGGLPTLSH